MSGLIDAAYRTGNSLTDVLILLLPPGPRIPTEGRCRDCVREDDVKDSNEVTSSSCKRMISPLGVGATAAAKKGNDESPKLLAGLLVG